MDNIAKLIEEKAQLNRRQKNYIMGLLNYVNRARKSIFMFTEEKMEFP